MALEGCKGGQWSCIKSGVLEVKASVHTVGGKLECHLLNIVLDTKNQHWGSLQVTKYEPG